MRHSTFAPTADPLIPMMSPARRRYALFLLASAGVVAFVGPRQRPKQRLSHTARNGARSVSRTYPPVSCYLWQHAALARDEKTVRSQIVNDDVQICNSNMLNEACDKQVRLRFIVKDPFFQPSRLQVRHSSQFFILPGTGRLDMLTTSRAWILDLKTRKLFL